MSKFTIGELIKGNKNIAQYYINAKQIWSEIRESEDFSSIETLSKNLEGTQSRFEVECGGKYMGREIMAFVGIGQFYNEYIGFENDYDDVFKIRDAVAQSFCSIEVKWYFENAIKHFGLDDVEIPK